MVTLNCNTKLIIHFQTNIRITCVCMAGNKTDTNIKYIRYWRVWCDFFTDIPSHQNNTFGLSLLQTTVSPICKCEVLVHSCVHLASFCQLCKELDKKEQWHTSLCVPSQLMGVVLLFCECQKNYKFTPTSWLGTGSKHLDLFSRGSELWISARFFFPSQSTKRFCEIRLYITRPSVIITLGD